EATAVGAGRAVGPEAVMVQPTDRLLQLPLQAGGGAAIARLRPGFPGAAPERPARDTAAPGIPGPGNPGPGTAESPAAAGPVDGRRAGPTAAAAEPQTGLRTD